MAERVYFIGANTGRGYEHHLAELRPREALARVCVVRGAMGTGRHLLLDALADRWESQGRPVTRFAGADGPVRTAAVISEGWAVLDGAMLRNTEDEPGDLQIDLSAALELSALRQERAHAGMLYRRTHSLRMRAWRCLQVAHTAWSDSAAIYAEAVDAGALMNLRLELSRWIQGASGGRQRVFAQAVTAEGVRSHANSLLRPETVCLDLPWGFDPDSVLYPIAAALQLRGSGTLTAMQLLDGGRLADLCTDSHALVSFVEPGCDTRTLPFDASVLRREQDALAFNRAAYDLWLRQGMDALAAARDCQDSLERLVGDALIPERRAAMIEQARRFYEG